MKYQAAIFDLDGTLIDSEAIARDAMRAVFRDRGFPLNDAEVAFMSGRSSRMLIPKFLRDRGVADLEMVQTALQEYRGCHSQLWEGGVALMPYAREVLQELRARNIPLGLATTSRGEVVARFLEQFGFDRIFRCVVSGDMVQQLKHDPEIYQLALDRIAIPHESVLAIEDTPVGVASAAAAGLACAAVVGAHPAGQSFLGATYVFASLRDILALF